MFYYLWYYLGADYTWLNIFRYITFRSFLAFTLSFLTVIILQPIFIRIIQAMFKSGQPIRDDGPESHAVKVGTPTMGGIVIIFSVFLSTLLFANLDVYFIWLVLMVFLGMACLGFADDWLKIKHKNPKGVSGKIKLLTQTSISLLVGLILLEQSFPTFLNVPFFKHLAIPLGLFFVVFTMIVIVGSSNAVNLTDGLDGLVIGPVITVALAFGIISYLVGNVEWSRYLNITYVSGAGELCIILSAVLASGLAFLWYNSYPAQVFMGDVGALALGGLLGTIAVIVKQEFLLAIAGGIFVIEAVSVIMQRYYYKLTKKRIFRMAPIHHHFELLGWPEPKVIVRFWIVSLMLAILALATLKLR